MSADKTNSYGVGAVDETISEQDAVQIIVDGLDACALQGKRVLVLIPDGTRSCPLPLLYRTLCEHLGPTAACLDFMIALGTHSAMSESAIAQHLGKTDSDWPQHKIFNHQWGEPEAMCQVGCIPSSKVQELSNGKLAIDVPVTINKRVMDYDALLIVGPVFPHEVAGMSGGRKYIFPGIAGADIIDFFHWLGALITNPRIIGHRQTPVRDVIDLAADMLPMEQKAICMVVKHHDLHGIYAGDIQPAWEAAADLAAKIHIKTIQQPYRRILAQAPEMYEDLWTAGKCMYKLESIVADDGELIIYAPHLTEISLIHGNVIEEIGYHCRDYFLADWEKFEHLPWGVLAHSSHVRGIGKMIDGEEHNRIRVTLASGVSAERCAAINLGYANPDDIDISCFEKQDDCLYVPKAGETLYRLANPPDWQAHP